MATTILEIDGKTFKLTAAEKYFLDRCGKGEWAKFGDHSRPKEPRTSVKIRAELVRFAMRKGNEDHRIHWRGPRLKGAWITGQIGLNLCKTEFALRATNCHFEEKLHLFDAEIFGVEIDGSWCPGIMAYRLRTAGPVMLENGFQSTGEIDLDYARIDGRLGLQGAVLTPRSKEWALTAEGARIRDEVSFSNLKVPEEVGSSYTLVEFAAHGPIRLRSMRIGGRFRLSGGTFKAAFFKGKMRPALDADGLNVRGDVRLNGGAQFDGNICLRSASVDGQVEISDIEVNGSFDLNSATVKQKLVLNPAKGAKPKKDGTQNKKIDLLDLRLATVGVLNDVEGCWETIKSFDITGFTYGDIDSDIRWGTRMKTMIARNKERRLLIPEAQAHNYGMDEVHEVSPQPFTHLARHLDAEGDRLQASWTRFDREKRVRHAHFAAARVRINEARYFESSFKTRERAMAWWYLIKTELRRILDFGFGMFFGYGHKPGRAIASIVGIWLFSVALYGGAYDRGQMAPNSDVILVSNEWQTAVTHQLACPLRDYDKPRPKVLNCVQPLKIWTGIQKSNVLAGSNASKDYENFNRYLYALDLFVPLDSLGQELAWVPARDRGEWGWWAYSLRWLIQMAGWIFTAVGAATITGLLARKE